MKSRRFRWKCMDMDNPPAGTCEQGTRVDGFGQQPCGRSGNSERLRAKGDTLSMLPDAIETLAVLEGSLRLFERHRRLIVDRLNG